MALPYYIQEGLNFMRSEKQPFFFPIHENEINIGDPHSYRNINGPFGTFIAELMRKQYMLDYDVCSNVFPAVTIDNIKYQITKCFKRDGSLFPYKPNLHIFAKEQIENLIREHPGELNRVFTIDLDNNYIGICKNFEGNVVINSVILVNFDPELDNYGNEDEQALQEIDLVPPPPPHSMRCYMGI